MSNSTAGYSDVEWAWAGVLGVVTLVFLFWWNHESPEEKAADRERALRAHIVVEAKNMLKNHLKDGKSASIKGVRAFTSNGLACGRVNAKNSFGAYSGYQRFLVDTESGVVMLEREAPQAILGLMPLACR